MTLKLNYLVTGGTGSFGKSFVSFVLKKKNTNKVVIFSRDEIKQEKMQKDLNFNPKLRFFLGDVRDKERLFRALDGIDYVVHAAALKIVPLAETNPFECVKTNIHGAMNVIDTCIERKVKKVIALSTDKACLPINLYGATKLASDKLFISSNVYSGKKKVIFSVVRYGNVFGSRGSIVPNLLNSKDNKEINLTDEKMTRFFLSLDQAVQMVFEAFQDMRGGEIYVKKAPSIKIIDLIKYLAPEKKIKRIDIRPGEKIHETMISLEDAIFTYETPKYYKIISPLFSIKRFNLKNLRKVKKDFYYSSYNNNEWIDELHLKKLVKDLNKISF